MLRRCDIEPRVGDEIVSRRCDADPRVGEMMESRCWESDPRDGEIMEFRRLLGCGILLGEGDLGDARDANEAVDAGRGESRGDGGAWDRRLDGRLVCLRLLDPGVEARRIAGELILRPVAIEGPEFRERGTGLCERRRDACGVASLDPAGLESSTTTQFLPSSSRSSVCLRFAAGLVGVDAPLLMPSLDCSGC